MSRNLNDVPVFPEFEKPDKTVDIFVLGDESSSMGGKKIAILNQAFRDGVSALKAEAKKHPEITYRFRCVSFATHAKWANGPDPSEMQSVVWNDLSASGMTATDEAIQMVTDVIQSSEMPAHTYPAIIVLVSDGAATDEKAYEQEIKNLDSIPFGKKAIRISIGVGMDYDRAQLEKFTNQEIGVLEATNAADLANYIQYVTTTVVDYAIKPPSVLPDGSYNAVIPPPPSSSDSGNDTQMELF